MLRYSANLGFLWKELPLVERVRRAKAAGFDAVEFHYPYDTPAETVKAALAEAGLPVAGINTRPGPSYSDFGLLALPGEEPAARAAIDEAIAYAKAIGAGYIHAMAGKAEGNDAHARYCAALDAAAGLAEPAGIVIVIEPLNRYDAPGYFLKTAEQAAEIIGEVGRPNLKILFDCYHAQIMGGDLTRRIERLMPLIGHMQIAGVPLRGEPDEGEVAYDRLLMAIDAMGYQGFVGAEYRPRGTVEEGLAWLGRFPRAGA
jgi:hydroxypyruvate isomerase